MCAGICNGAGAGICDGAPSTCSSSVCAMALARGYAMVRHRLALVQFVSDSMEFTYRLNLQK